jgi:hypothetical protein
MKVALPVFVAAAWGFTVSTPAWSGNEAVALAGNLVLSAPTGEQPLFPTAPSPGYILYSGYTGPLPAPNCYWTRMPIYDAERNVVGWRGRPIAVCPMARVSAEAAN